MQRTPQGQGSGRMQKRNAQRRKNWQQRKHWPDQPAEDAEDDLEVAVAHEVVEADPAKLALLHGALHADDEMVHIRMCVIGFGRRQTAAARDLASNDPAESGFPLQHELSSRICRVQGITRR